MQQEKWMKVTGISRLILVSLAVFPALRGQSMALPASDPVGISRAGAGVAYGRSLEAASLNPALLVTLQDRRSAFIAIGEEMESAQLTLQNNQRSLYTTDRNRWIPSFGGAWKLRDNLSFGLKLDQPYLRHGRVPIESPTRFEGKGLDLKTMRVEFQGAWSPKGRPDLSFGLGLGMVRVDYASTITVRALVPTNAALPSTGISGSNPVQDLMETDLRQADSKIVPSATLGFRYALNPRWTLGASYQAPIKGTLSLSASYADRPPVYFSPDGYGLGNIGAGSRGAVLLANSTLRGGQGDFTLPGRMSLGIRQRLTQFFTWEVDARYQWGSSLRLPASPIMSTPSGAVSSPIAPAQPRSGFGLSAMGELNLTKLWILRFGVAIDPALYQDQDVSPLRGGSKSAAFSAGAGHRIWGGEISVGYQYRQAQDHDTTRLDGAWSYMGYRSNTGSVIRVEGMGHLWSIGFKKSF